jgi:hypothetical protein
VILVLASDIEYKHDFGLIDSQESTKDSKLITKDSLSIAQQHSTARHNTALQSLQPLESS